jgi:hypothetical protein
MPAQLAHLWSTRGTQAPRTGMPVPPCQGVACMLLTVWLASAAGAPPCPWHEARAPAHAQPVHGQRLLLMPCAKRPYTQYGSCSSVSQPA